MNPDVIALEEMGTTNALLELRASLKADGLDFPFWEHVSGADTNIHVAVLSRLPIVARRPHTNDLFLLDGRQFRVERGFAEVDIQAATNFTFTLIAAHLKSRLPSPVADEAEERLAEAKVLRGIIDEHFTNNPDARLVVLGDFNDVKDSDAVKEIIGRGKFKLTDTRPAERNGDNAPGPPPYFEPRNVAWTYFYGADDTYSPHGLHFVESRDGARLGEGGDLYSHDSKLGRRLRPPAHRRGVSGGNQLKSRMHS